MNRILRLVILGMLFAFQHLTGFAQTDSLHAVLDTASGQNRWNTLYEIAWDFSYIQPDSGLYFARILRSEAAAAEDEFFLGKANKALAICNHKGGNLDSASIFTDRAIQHFYAVNDTLGVISSMSNGGGILRDMGQYEASLKYFLLARKGAIVSNNDWLTVAVELNISNLYAAMGKDKRSAKVLFEAKERALALGDPRIIAHVYSLMGLQTTYQDRDSAIFYLETSKQMHQELGDFEEYANCLNNLGVVYLNFGEPEKAYEYFLRYKTIQDSLNVRLDIPLANMNLGLSMVYLDREEEGFELMREAWRGSIEEGVYDNLPGIFENYAIAFQHLNNADSAIYYSRMQKQIEDSMANMEILTRMQELQTKYYTEQQAREIAELEHQNEIRGRRQLVLWIVAGGLFLLSLLAGGMLFLYFQQRQLKMRQKAADLEQRALRAQMNPHFIFNSLNSVQMLFMQEDFVRANEYLGDFGQLLRNILEHSSQKKISLEEELETLRIYLSVEQMRLGEKLNFEILVEEGLDIDELQIPSLILQPFVENAIWHGIAPKEGPGSIKVEIKEIGYDLLLCTITDDGVGLRASSKNRNKAHHSRGMQITRERLGHKGNIYLKELTAPDGSPLGTRVELKIPI